MRGSIRLFVSASFLFLTSTTVFPLRAAPTTTDVVLQSISGDVEFSTQPGQWQPLRLDSKVIGGSVIRTHEKSTVDFFLKESKTTLRLTPDSELAFESLNRSEERRVGKEC